MVGASNAKSLTDTYYGGVYLDRFTGHFDNNIWSLELNAEGPLFQLPGGAARLAVGGGLRNTKLTVHNVDVADGVATTYADFRSDERRVGKECVSKCRSR